MIAGGKYGAVNGVPTTRNWSLVQTSATKPFIASNTAGGTGRRRGPRDWTGSVSHYGGVPASMPGETMAFQGYTAPTNGVGGTAGQTYSGTAIVENVSITWNWETGDIIASVINFAANGVLSQSSTIVTDGDPITAPSPIGGGVRILDAGGSTYDELCPVVSATLNITAANKPYVNSCSAGQTLRKPGPIDWNLALVLQENDLASLPFDIDDFIGIQIDVDDSGTQFWQLTYGLVKDFSGFTIDRETGNIITVTANIEMSIDDGEGNEDGAIIMPGSAAWWEGN